MRASIEAWTDVSHCPIQASSWNATLWYSNYNATWCITGDRVWLIITQPLSGLLWELSSLIRTSSSLPIAWILSSAHVHTMLFSYIPCKKHIYVEHILVTHKPYWGIPLDKCLIVDDTPWIITNCFLFVRYEQYQEKHVPVISTHILHLFKWIWWPIVLKAALRSWHTKRWALFWFSVQMISFFRHIIAVSVKWYILCDAILFHMLHGLNVHYFLH